MYAKANVSLNRIDHLCFMEDYIESLCVESVLNYETIFVCVIYRIPGSSFDSFVNKYQQILQYIGNKNSIISGDFNIDLLKYECSNIVETFVNLSYKYSLTPVINKPTRITNHSATVIDHIWCNVRLETLLSGVLLSDASDHFSPFIQIFGNENKIIKSVNNS